MSIIKLSKQMVDPRVLGRTTYKMEHIIYITIAAVIAGAQSWNDISEFGKEKFDFFKERLDGLKSFQVTTPLTASFLFSLPIVSKRYSGTGSRKLLVS